MAKFLGLVLILGLGAGIGLLVRQQLPDIQRYLRIRSM